MVRIATTEGNLHATSQATRKSAIAIVRAILSEVKLVAGGSAADDQASSL